MNWLKSLLGLKPDRIRATETGFYWQIEGLPALAAGKGWTQPVAGESFYRDTLRRLAGGRSKYGALVSKAAVLSAGAYEGSPAVFVEIDDKRVGAIPREDCAALYEELVATSPAGKASAKAQISAGYERSDFSVKLSLARPLRVRHK